MNHLQISRLMMLEILKNLEDRGEIVNKGFEKKTKWVLAKKNEN